MDKNKALAARIHMAESALIVILAQIAKDTTQPKRSATQLYQRIFAIASTRYVRSQPGPEKEVSGRAMTEVHMLFERLMELIEDDGA